MKLAYVAQFAHTFSTETHVAHDAELLGHTVTRITTTKPGDIETEAAGHDLVICQRTGLSSALVDVWRRLETAGTPTCSFHLDLYVGLKRQTQIATDPFWRTGTVFTADGDPHSAEVFASHGVNHRWLPAAVVSDETNKGKWRDEYDHDIVFVGSVNYHPEWPWRGQLLDFLKKRYRERFHVFDHHPPTRDQDLNDLYATARIVVGDTLCLPGHMNFWSDRYYETVGRGGFLIAPYVDGLEQHFTHHHLRYYTPGNTNSVAGGIDHYLNHPLEARRIADSGQHHIRAHHTYQHRVREMLRAVT